jgi:hypothetical protein
MVTPVAVSGLKQGQIGGGKSHLLGDRLLVEARALTELLHGQTDRLGINLLTGAGTAVTRFGFCLHRALD